jgi:hypothetical protein
MQVKTYRRPEGLRICCPLRRKDHEVGDGDARNLRLRRQHGIDCWVALVLIDHRSIDELFGRILVRDVARRCC